MQKKEKKKKWNDTPPITVICMCPNFTETKLFQLNTIVSCYLISDI